MNARLAGMLAAMGLAVMMITPQARAQQVQVEKIPLQHIDARIVAALLGAPVLPNELEVMQQRSFGGGLASGYGYGGGSGAGASPYGGAYNGSGIMRGYPGNAMPSGYPSAVAPTANGRAPWFAQGAGATVGAPPVIVADPRTNALIAGR